MGEITSTADVTRQTFYYYFPNKAAAVGAFLTDVLDDVLTDYYETLPGSPAERVRPWFQAVVPAWRARASLIVAMLNALATDAETRQSWNDWMDSRGPRRSPDPARTRRGGCR